MKSFLKSFFFYTAVPSLMLVLSIGAYSSTHSVISALVPALAAGISFVVTREQEDTDSNAIRTTFVAATFFFIGYWFLYQLQLPMSPWGITGWVFFACVVMTCFITAAIQISFRLDEEFWNTFLEILVLIGCLSHIYLFWGTFFIWIPLATFVVYEYVLMGLDWNWKENANHWELVATVSIIGAASTLTQFWYLDVLGYPLWKVSLAVFVVVAFIAAVILLERRADNKKLEKEKEEQRIVAEKNDLEQKRLKREQLAEEERNKNKSLDELTEKLLNAETVSVADVHDLIKGGRKIPFDVIAKIDFRQLFQVSEVKNQITWKSNQLDDIFKQLHIFFVSCYDDDLLKKTIEHCLQLKDLSKYVGYEALRRSIMQIRDVSEYVQLPEAPEKKPEQITN